MNRTVLRLFALATVLALLLPSGGAAVCSTASTPASVIDLAATAIEHDVLLTWSNLGEGIDHYDIHRSRSPYFEPGDASFVESVLPDAGATLTYPDAGRSSTADYFYAVVPVEAGGLAQAASNRVGVVNYDLSGRTYDPAACVDLYINEVMFAPGAGGHEWVELKNVGTAPIQPAGCGVTDEDENWYVLPDTLLEMPAGAFLVVVFDGQGAAADDLDFSDSVATVHTQPWLVDVFEDGADQVALYGPPAYTITEIVSFIAWGADPEFDDDAAVTAGIWGEGLYKDLRELGDETPLPVLPDRSLGLVPGGFPYLPDEWVHYQESEVTPGQANPVPGAAISDPVPGMIIEQTTFAIGWQSVDGATGYHFQMDDDIGFGSPDYDLILDAPSFTPTSTVAEGRYYWRVAVVRADLVSGWSATVEVNCLRLPSPPTATAAKGIPSTDSTVTDDVVFDWEVLGIVWQLQRKDTEMVCRYKDSETALVGELNAPWDAPHDEMVRKDHGKSYCERASLSMLASFYGGHLSQDRIAYRDYGDYDDDLFRDSNATDNDLGHGIINKRGITADLKWALGTPIAAQRPPDFVTVKGWIDNQQPFIVWGNVWGEPHFRVVDGYGDFQWDDLTQQWVHVLDPWRDPVSEEDPENLLKGEWRLWNDVANQTDYLWVGPAGPGGAPDVRSDEPEIHMDSDNDGLVDFDEIYRFGTYPNDSDTDDDGVPDKEDMREYLFDNDGLYSPKETDLKLAADRDWDGVPKERDPDNDRKNNDGSSDGCEDTNHNGKFEPALDETSNFDPISERPCPAVYFREDFEGTALDTSQWVAFANGGAITVSDGLLRAERGYGNAFPYIYASTDPYPQGNFTLRMAMRYISAGGFGTGVQLARYLPGNGGVSCQFSPGPTSGLPVAAIWQSNSNVLVAHLDRPLPFWMVANPSGNSVQAGTAPQAQFHLYEIRFDSGMVRISLDGVELTSSTTLADHPHWLWFGNPALCSSGYWSGFEIDYIVVAAD